jgi:hypothetical protein
LTATIKPAESTATIGSIRASISRVVASSIAKLFSSSGGRRPAGGIGRSQEYASRVSFLRLILGNSNHGTPRCFIRHRRHTDAGPVTRFDLGPEQARVVSAFTTRSLVYVTFPADNSRGGSAGQGRESPSVETPARPGVPGYLEWACALATGKPILIGRSAVPSRPDVCGDQRSLALGDRAMCVSRETRRSSDRPERRISGFVHARP